LTKPGNRYGGNPPQIEELFDDANGVLAIVVNYSAAIEKYRRCVEQVPEFFDGWHALGMAHEAWRLSGSHRGRQKSGELRPNDQLAWSSLRSSTFTIARSKKEAAGTKARILSWGAKPLENEDVKYFVTTAIDYTNGEPAHWARLRKDARRRHLQVSPGI
jgi:hypothetical protein